jgi:hypothetical protein
MRLDVSVVNPDDIFDADAREFGEPTNGPWVRVRCDDPFCDYKVAVMAEDGAKALGEKVFSLIAEDLTPIAPIGETERPQESERSDG